MGLAEWSNSKSTCLSKHEALSSNPSAAKKEKKRKSLHMLQITVLGDPVKGLVFRWLKQNEVCLDAQCIANAYFKH
jgi:hypothetical protein